MGDSLKMKTFILHSVCRVVICFDHCAPAGNNFRRRCSPPRAKYCMLCRLKADQVTGIHANVTSR
ncbi:hypothetical protein EBO33_15130 [[Curtobacterium] plantarum]|jgi:hypothetical protein|nr:hypothetical protein EBO33_15130 [[Curtobacterium] plantarum]